MNIQEACELLEIPTGVSKAEVKKAFRDKSKKLHPDVNKSETAEADFKKINEAYQILNEYGTDPSSFIGNGQGFHADMNSHLNDLFTSFFGGTNPFSYHGFRSQADDIRVTVDISFQEAIFGCSKIIEYTRRNLCKKCSGIGTINNKKETCTKCNGEKTRTYPGQNKKLPCTSCRAQGFVYTSGDACPDCKGSRIRVYTEKRNVKIPPGINNNTNLIVSGVGHFNPKLNAAGNIIIDVNVINSDGFVRDGRNIVSKKIISLLDALKGTTIDVKTVKGNKKLKIPPGTKNKDILQIKGYGVPPSGSHVVIMEVEYPKDTKPIIEILEKNNV